MLLLLRAVCHSCHKYTFHLPLENIPRGSFVSKNIVKKYDLPKAILGDEKYFSLADLVDILMNLV